MVKGMGTVGKWVALVGFFGAIIAGTGAGLGLFKLEAMLLSLFAIAGLVVGLTNINSKEQQGVMLAAIVLTIASGSLTLVPAVGEVIQKIATTLLVFVAPVALVTAGLVAYKSTK